MRIPKSATWDWPISTKLAEFGHRSGYFEPACQAVACHISVNSLRMFTLSRMTWVEEVARSVQTSREISKRHPGSLVLRPFLFALFEFGKETLEERKQFTIGFEFLLIDPMADWIRSNTLSGLTNWPTPSAGWRKTPVAIPARMAAPGRLLQ